MYKLTDKKRKLLQVRGQITLAYINGWSLRDLATANITSPGSIRNLLIEEGIALRQRGRQKKEN